MLSCAALLSSNPAAAEPSHAARQQRTLLYAGTALLLGGVATDATFWAAVDTTDDAAPWAWHLVPVAGPIIGLTDVDTLCPGGDALHGCALPKGMAYVGMAVSLVLQTAGLALLGIQAFDGDSDSGGSSSPATRRSLSLPFDLAVSGDSLLLRSRWSL